MATRLYFNVETIPYNPATLRGAWDATGTPSTGKLASVPLGSATNITKAETSATNNFDILFGKWVSAGLLEAITIDGTVDFILRVSEANADANAFYHIHIFVTAGDSNTVRGTLLSDYIGSTEFTTTAGARLVSGVSLSSVNAQVGDRIVVEVGAQLQNTHTTSRNIIIGYGGTNTIDSTNGDTTAAHPKWIEFSKNLPLLAKMETLTDNFDDNSIDAAKWTNWGGAQVVETNQELELTSTLGAGDYYGMESVVPYTLNESFASFKVVDTGNLALTSYLFYFTLFKNSDNLVSMIFKNIAGTPSIVAEKAVAGAFTDMATAAYNSSTMKYVRIRETSGTCYWEYSATGLPGSWTTLWSESDPFNLSALFAEPAIGTDAVEATSTVGKWDDFNILPSGVRIPRMGFINHANPGIA